MSDFNVLPASQPEEGSSGNNDEKVEVAKHEAAHLTDGVQEQAGNLADTLKSETESVARDAKREVHGLYDEARRELMDQATHQQERVAGGLRSVSEELGSMAASSEQPGVASELVAQVSERSETMANWLENRTPGGVVAEVKSFARRKPGTFIIAAALAGLVAGRLTRALTSESSSPSAVSSRGTNAEPADSELSGFAEPGGALAERETDDALRSLYATEGLMPEAPRETPTDPTRLREDLR